MAERSTLERAIQLALIAHEGQRDWNGRPFILHPMRVGMALVEKYGEDLGAVGVLHDSVEDSEGRVTYHGISVDCGDFIANIVQLLTRKPGQDYWSYIKMLSVSREATRVKLADLTDNLSPFRLMVADQKQEATLLKHGQAFHMLRGLAVDRGWL